MRLLENDLLTPLLLQRFRLEGEFEGADGRHYGIMPRDDNSLLVHHPGSPSLDPMQMLWAGDVLKLLNRDLHHDGAWVIVFTHPVPVTPDVVPMLPKHQVYGRYAIIWVDEDGDPQFSMEWEIGISSELKHFADVVAQGIEATAQKAEGSWQLWHTAMRKVLAPKQDQLFKKAKGQRAPSARH